MNQDTTNEVARLREELQRLRVDFTNLRESYSRAMMKEVRDLQKLEKAEAECAKWRKVAESLAHKPKPKLDQRKFAKQDWWDKKLVNDK
jgi:chromosome segregation ATPase